MGPALCMLFQTGIQVLTCVDAWNSAFLSSFQSGFRLLTELNLEPGALFKLATGASELLHVVSGFLADIRIGARKSGLISSGWGNQGLSNCDKVPGLPSSVK